MKAKATMRISAKSGPPRRAFLAMKRKTAPLAREQRCGTRRADI
jgi:hypothetical protein